MPGIILLVDDMNGWHEPIRTLLEDEGYEVICLTTRREARKIMTSGLPISVAIVNLNLLPRGQILDGIGYSVLEDIAQERPCLPRMAISAFQDPGTSKVGAAKVAELYTRYGVKHVGVKSMPSFNHDLVHAINTITRSLPPAPPPIARLSTADRVQLMAQLVAVPGWRTGLHPERMMILSGCGLMIQFLSNLNLQGPPDGTAATVLDGLEQYPGLVDNQSQYRPLGLLVKCLFENCIELEGKQFLAAIFVRYSLTTDQAWLASLVPYLVQLNNGERE